MTWIPVVNQIFTKESFQTYVAGLHVVDWKPIGIVLHNTAEPTLADWLNSSWQKHVIGLSSYYQGLGWHAGPHLFVAPEGIIAFTPITEPGVHSPSWNHTKLGVEMVGDYNSEAFNSGQGLLVHSLAVSAVATLCQKFHLDSSTLKLHKEDPRTTHDCPGKHVDKASFIQEVHNELVRRKPVIV